KAFCRLEAMVKPLLSLSAAAHDLYRIHGYLLRCEDEEHRSTDALLTEAEGLMIDYPDHPLAGSIAQSLLAMKVPVRDTVARLRAMARHGPAAKQSKYADLADSLDPMRSVRMTPLDRRGEPVTDPKTQ